MARGNEGGTPTPEEELQELLLEYSKDLETKQLSVRELLWMFRDMGAAIEQVPEVEEAMAEGIAEVGSQIHAMAKERHGVDLKKLDGEVDQMIQYGGTELPVAIELVAKKHSPEPKPAEPAPTEPEPVVARPPEPVEEADPDPGKTVVMTARHVYGRGGGGPLDPARVRSPKPAPVAERTELEKVVEPALEIEASDLPVAEKLSGEEEFDRLQDELMALGHRAAKEIERDQTWVGIHLGIERIFKILHSNDPAKGLKRYITNSAKYPPGSPAARYLPNFAHKLLVALNRLPQEQEVATDTKTDTQKKDLPAWAQLDAEGRVKLKLAKINTKPVKVKPEEPQRVSGPASKLTEAERELLDKYRKSKDYKWDGQNYTTGKSTGATIWSSEHPFGLTEPRSTKDVRMEAGSRGDKKYVEARPTREKVKEESPDEIARKKELEAKKKELEIIFGSLKDNLALLESTRASVSEAHAKLRALEPMSPDATSLAETDALIAALKPTVERGDVVYIAAHESDLGNATKALEKGLEQVTEMLTRAEAEERTILAHVTDAEGRKTLERVQKENQIRKQKDLRALVRLLEGKGVMLRDLDARLNVADPTRVAAGAAETECAVVIRKIAESLPVLQDLMDLDISKIDRTSTPNLTELRTELTSRLKELKGALRLCDGVIARAEAELKTAETRARARTRPPSTIEQIVKDVEAAGGSVSSAEENRIRQVLDGEMSRMFAEARSMNRDTPKAVVMTLRRSARNVIKIAERIGIKRQKFEAENVENILQGLLKQRAEREAKAAREAAAVARRTGGAAGAEGTEGAPDPAAGAGAEEEGDEEEAAAGGEAGAGAGAPETGPSHAELMAASYEQYGISQDDVNNIPGYENLSEGQQIMALQNLGHLVLGRVEADAIQSYEREYRQGNFVTSFFRRFKMRWWREDYMDKHRQDAALLYKRDGGMNSDFLRNLVREFNNKGPEVIRETKGGRKILRVQWFNEKLITPEFDMAYPGTFNAVRNFNEAADKFAQVPRAWGQEGSTNDQAKWYEEYTKRYLRARDALMAKLDPHRTGLNQRLVDKVFEAGNLVEENQILHSHTGDADDEFKRIMNGR